MPSLASGSRHGVTYLKGTIAQIEADRAAGLLVVHCLYETTDEANGEPRRGRAVKVDKIKWETRIYDEEYDSDEDAKTRGNLAVGDSYVLSSNNNDALPGLHKKILASLFFLFLSLSLSAQLVQKSGAPNFIPITNQAYMWNDTLNKKVYLFKRPKWFYQGELVRYGTPNDSTYTVSGTSITVSYTDAKLYNLTTNTYWDYVRSSYDGAWTWQNRQNLIIDSLLAKNNIWTGKNEFQDSLKVQKGLISGGLIDSKGVKSDGSATVAAVNANGVQKSATVMITGNTTIDGTYNTIYANTASGNITITLPSITTNNTGWSYTIMKTAPTNTLFIARPSSSTITIVSNNYSVTIKNNGISWEIQ